MENNVSQEILKDIAPQQSEILRNIALQQSGQNIAHLKYGNEEYYYLHIEIPGNLNFQSTVTFMKSMDRNLIIDVSRKIAQAYAAKLVIEQAFYEEDWARTVFAGSGVGCRRRGYYTHPILFHANVFRRQ